MRKPVTVKDVLYALQHAGQRLVRNPTDRAGQTAVWALEPSGARVANSVADEARAIGNLVPSQEPGSTSIAYSWPEAA